jgi:uncharacterized UPF0160 family protein
VKKKIVRRSLGTHDGSFHADEVTACALLVLFGEVDEEKIVRTRNLDILEECEYVCDVGGVYDPSKKKFDHHQVEYQGPMSSAGMVLEYLRETGKIDHNIFTLLRSKLIAGVDDHDNGLEPQTPGLCTYSHIIANFNPLDYNSSAEAFDKAFQEALQFAKGHLTRMLERYKYMLSCRADVEEAMKCDKDVLIFSRSLPWMDAFFELGGEDHPATFVIMPSGTHWKLRGIPPSANEKMSVRVSLPKKWAGLLDRDLMEASGISGAIFCHKGRFISVWETKEAALKAMKKALKKR